MEHSSANGSGTSYAEGDPYNITFDVTLYAQWTAANGVSVSGTLSSFSACAGSFYVISILLVVSGGGLDTGNPNAITIPAIPPG